MPTQTALFTLPSLDELPPAIAGRITIHPASGCWIAGGNHDKDGYARYAGEGLHRVVWRHFYGEIPPATPVLDHVVAWGCISRACCWPLHLEPVTSAVNCLRGNSFAAINARKDECDHRHPYTPENTYIKPDGHRDCRQCIRDRVRRYKQRGRARTGSGTFYLSFSTPVLTAGDVAQLASLVQTGQAA